MFEFEADGEGDSGSAPNDRPGSLKSPSVELKECLNELKKLQQEHDLLESQYHDKLARIEADYMRSIEPICSERLREVSWTDVNARGIYRFWLTVMTGVKDFSEKEITDRDEHALSFLTDIKWSPLDDHKGWKLDFFFDSDNNLYFDNPVLTKEIYFSMIRGRRCIEKIAGTEINWRPGECLLQKTVKKLNKKVLVKTDSFFNFFVGDQCININNGEECDHLIKLCQKFMIRFIPHAQHIFTNAMRCVDNKLEKEYSFLSNGAGKMFFHQQKLHQLQVKIEEFESLMFQQIREVHDLYWESVKPLHERRSELVDEFLVAQRSPVESEEQKEKLGPAFWLNAMRGEETLGLMISDEDAKALRYLKTIVFSERGEHVHSFNYRKTWKTEFFFNPNPYFENAVLTKELTIQHIEGLSEPTETKGTGIEWLPGGFLLDDPERVGTVESFFNLFDDEGYRLEDLRRDYKTCRIIVYRIISHAASFYLDSF